MFHRETLINETKTFCLNQDTLLSQEQLRYASYYGLHFSGSNVKGLSSGPNPDIAHKMGHFSVGEHRLFAQSWEDKNHLCQGTLLLFHGYLDHLGLYKHIIEYGLSRHLRVVGFDLPGHGISSGEQAVIHDFLDYQDIMDAWLHLHNEQSPKPWYLIAQSTGAAIAMDYLFTNQQDESKSPFRKVAFLAPLVRPTGLLKTKLLYFSLKPFKRYVDRSFKQNSNDAAFSEFLRSLDPLQSKRISREWVGALFQYISRIESAKPIPITPLVIQGDQDRTVNFIHNLAIIEQKFWQPRVIYLDGAMHHLANETENYRRIILSELDRWFDLKEPI